MDRRQWVVQRTREYFGERIDDVIHMVRQDRQNMRGWEEPAHLRAVARRAMRAEGGTLTESSVSVAELELGRTAGEPDRGQQREATGQLLEAGANGLEKVARSTSQELTPEEMLGLECVLLLYGRPAVAMWDGKLARVPPFWNLLEDQREDIEMAQRGVGRIEMLGHPEYDWAGTAFLVSETMLVTTRRTVELFAENRSGSWQFRPGISAWMDYRPGYQEVSNAGYRIRSVVGVHESYDLAVLEVEPPQVNGSSPVPLALASQAPQQLEGRPVYLIGYPVRDARRNEPEQITRIFRDVYNVKRVQPGQLRGVMQFREVQLLRHDCAPLGESAGCCILDLETHQVLGMHLCSRYMESGTAIPMWVLRNDSLLQRAGVTFAQADSHEQEQVSCQLERLARSRYWKDARKTIDELYQRAFGK